VIFLSPKKRNGFSTKKRFSQLKKNKKLRIDNFTLRPQKKIHTSHQAQNPKKNTLNSHQFEDAHLDILLSHGLDLTNDLANFSPVGRFKVLKPFISRLSTNELGSFIYIYIIYREITQFSKMFIHY